MSSYYTRSSPKSQGRNNNNANIFNTIIPSWYKTENSSGGSTKNPKTHHHEREKNVNEERRKKKKEKVVEVQRAHGTTNTLPNSRRRD